MNYTTHMIDNLGLLRFVGLMMCLLALASVKEHSSVPISNTLLYYMGAYSTIAVSIYILFKEKYYKKPAFICIFIFLIWGIFGIVRGLFAVNSYWVFNQLIRGTLATLVPVVVFLFSNPINCVGVLRIINLFLPISALLLTGWAVPLSDNVYLLVPFFTLYVFFIRDMPKKWIFITLASIAVILMSVDNRSGILKTAFSLMILFISVLPGILKYITLNIVHWGCYAVPFVLLYLGWSGNYNFFNPTMFQTSKVVTVNYSSEEDDAIGDDYTLDTRTFIYIESMESALDNDHLWTGRTPARGYSSPYFYKLFGKAEGASGIDDDERFQSEVGHLNFFVWHGIIGVILILAIYLWGTILALYKSKNIYVKMVGTLVAFMWGYGWIENPYHFMILDITIFLMIAMCYSPAFRRMSDTDFKLFIRDIFLPPSQVSILKVYKQLKVRQLLYILRNQKSLFKQ